MRIQLLEGTGSGACHGRYAKLEYYTTNEVVPSGIAIEFHQTPEGHQASFINQIKVLREQNYNDAEITKAIYQNDTKAVERMLATKEITARHVTAQGHSLISWAVNDGASAVFRLLLEDGADPNYCYWADNTVDLIYLIWDLWTDWVWSGGVYGLGGISRAPKMKVEDCILMSELALKYGCCVNATLVHTMDFASPLFLNETCSERQLQSSADILVMVTFLSRIGFDLEQRNSYGQTPLLHSCLLVGHDADAKVEAMLTCLAKKNVFDNFGRGPLHSAIFVRRTWRTCFPTADAVCERGDLDYDDNDMLEFDAEDFQASTVQHMDRASIEAEDLCERCWRSLKSKVLSLLRIGCDPNATDSKGRTPSDYAWRNGLFWCAWEEALAETGWDYHDEKLECMGSHIAMFEQAEALHKGQKLGAYIDTWTRAATIGRRDR